MNRVDKEIAIVLYTCAYNDKYSIVQVYTRGEGRASLLAPLPSRRSKGRQRALFIPFSILEIEARQLSGSELYRITQAQLSIPLQGLTFDPIKSAITLFLAEVVARSVREREQNEALFQFLAHAIQLLDKMEGGVANFHLCFLIQLSGYLGFFPNGEGYATGKLFDMELGQFVTQPPLHAHYLDATQSQVFASLLRINFLNLHLFRFTGEQRSLILEQIITYYALHIDGFGTVKGLEVLRTIFAT